MVIYNAEKFGLATLHQLRGRVGRSNIQSYCILQKSFPEAEGVNLDILCNETDGYEIAKEDLKHRGTGDLIGTEQSGKNKYIEMMIQYPNMYEKVKRDAKEMFEKGLSEEYIEKYEQLFCE